MRQLALEGLVRRWLVRLHRWSGLVVMAGLLVAAITGVWLVFRVELDRVVNPQLRVVQPVGQRLPLSAINAAVMTRYPDAAVSTFSLPERPDDAMTVFVKSTTSTPLDIELLFINPYDGRILGARSSRLGFNRESLDPFILRLHYSLLMKGWGLWVMGVCALVWLLTNFIGLALSWPRLWLRLFSWVPMLRAQVSKGPYRANYQLHRAVGMWLLVPSTVLAFTSVELNLPQYIRPVVNALSPLTAAPPGQKHQPGEEIVSVDQALNTLQYRFPEAHTNSIYRDTRNGRYSIYFYLPGDVSTHGDNFAFVDLQSGAITAIKRPATLATGDRFMTWLYPLHTGTAFGLPGRWLVLVTGVGLALLNITGLYVWWYKWRFRVRAKSRARTVTHREREHSSEAA